MAAAIIHEADECLDAIIELWIDPTVGFANARSYRDAIFGGHCFVCLFTYFVVLSTRCVIWSRFCQGNIITDGASPAGF